VAVEATLDEPLLAARLVGAAQTIRRESDMLLTEGEAALLEEYIGPVRAAVTAQEWDAELVAGRALAQPEAIALLRSLGSGR
jgi:hypothetical protein